MLSARSTFSGVSLGLLVLFQPFATSHSAGVGDVVPGMVVVRFTGAANPPLTAIQLSPAEFGISAIDAALASVPSAELRPFLPDRHASPSPARSWLERTYILRFAESANPDTIAALLAPFTEFESWSRSRPAHE